MTLKERIKELCKENGISMNQLEKEIGVGSGYISKIGSSTPNMKNIQKIAEYFNVSTDYLMLGKDVEKYSPEQAKLIIEIRKDKGLAKALRRYFELSSEQKKHILDAIELFDKEKNNKND